MKHLKPYEAVLNYPDSHSPKKYDVIEYQDYPDGTYIKLKDYSFYDELSKIYVKVPQEQFVKIIRKDMQRNFKPTDQYYIEFTDGSHDVISITNIEREMTPEEIKEYELEKSTKKYNL